MTISHTKLDTPLGVLTIVGDEAAITGVYFEDHSTQPDPRRFGPERGDGFQEAVGQLGEYFDGRRTSFELPVRLEGSEFRLAVWKLISEIPYGETTTYGEMASALGRPREARKVGGAVGRNPVSLIVPCHRVIGSDGSLTGYAGGLPRKRYLLDLESCAAPQLQLTA